jgi:serine/threonine protein kinase
MSECPTSEILSCFADGESIDGVEAHLDSCLQCREWLDTYFKKSFQGTKSTTVPRHLIEAALKATRNADHDLPRTVGDYELLELIGRGGMGVVYRAHDKNLQREVAIKALAPALLANPEAIERFQREARAAAALDHQNVLPIHAFGGLEDSTNFPFIAMPLIRGESLESKIRREGKLSVKETLDLARQIASGLTAAHEAGIVHRDIKPGNILIDTDGKALIADFGLARMGDDASLTLPDVRAGTPQFMAPEQALGQPVSYATDLFCFGAMLYNMLVGHLPFPGKSTPEVLHALSITSPDPVRKVRPDVPAWLSHLIELLLEKNPADRPASTRMVADMLATESAPGHPSRRQRKKRRYLIGLFILALAATTFIALEKTGRSALVNAALSKTTGRPFSIRGQWGTFDQLNTVCDTAKEGDVIDIHLRRDLLVTPMSAVAKSITLSGHGTGRLLETRGQTLFRGQGDCVFENLIIIRNGGDDGSPQSLISHRQGTLTLNQCLIAVENLATFEQLGRREAVLRLDDASLTARNSILSSSSSYAIHLTGQHPASFSFDNCGIRGFALLVPEGSNAAITVDIHRSTLSTLGLFLSPRGRSLPKISITGDSNLIRCGVLVWKNDARANSLKSIDWQMKDSVLGEFRFLFGRGESIRQFPAASEAVKTDFAAVWPEAALSLQFSNDLGLPKQQLSVGKPEEFISAAEWSKYGFQSQSR